MHFLLFYYERWNVPLAEFLVPLRLALDLVHLLVVHQESDDLLEKVQFFGLLANRFQEVFVLLGVLFVDVLQLIIGVFEFLT